MFPLSVNIPDVKGEVRVKAVDPPIAAEIVLAVLLLLISSDDKLTEVPLKSTLPLPEAIVKDPLELTVPLRIAIPDAPLPPVPPFVEPPPPPDPGVTPLAPGELHP